MEIGIFLPIAKGGFIISRNVPPTWPTWELNRDVTLKCEHHGFDFALSMVKFRGFGGETEYWDHALDSFTLTAQLAPLTRRIPAHFLPSRFCRSTRRWLRRWRSRSKRRVRAGSA